MAKRRISIFISIALVFSMLLTSCGSSELKISFEPEPVVRENVKFSELPYHLPKSDDFKATMRAFAYNMNAAKSAEEQIELIVEYDEIIRWYSDLHDISYIRYVQNMTDETRADYEHFLQFGADVQIDNNNSNLAIVNSKYIEDLETYFGKDTIDLYRNKVEQYDANKARLSTNIATLLNQYDEMIATNSMLSKEADNIFNEMLTIREELAELSGYDSYSEYAYSNRSISLEDVKAFIADVKQTVLPVYQKLSNNAQIRAKLCPAAREVKTVASTSEEELELSLQVLRATLDEMDPMIDYMEQNDMFDIMPSDNKIPQNVTGFLSGAQIPFVIMTYPNADTIFHEFGHAFEFFEYPKIDLMERFYITPESAEVSSMCMEVLATTQYEIYYGDTADYARMKMVYNKTVDLLNTAMNCEFELALYDSPGMSQSERNDLFSELRKEYRLDMLGSFKWVNIRHYFSHPMYFVSYAIDAAVALDLWRVLQEDTERAKEIYLNYIHDGTQQDFVTRLKNAGLGNPFEKQNLEELARFLDELFSSEEYINPTNSTTTGLKPVGWLRLKPPKVCRQRRSYHHVEILLLPDSECIAQ